MAKRIQGRVLAYNKSFEQTHQTELRASRWVHLRRCSTQSLCV